MCVCVCVCVCVYVTCSENSGIYRTQSRVSTRIQHLIGLSCYVHSRPLPSCYDKMLLRCVGLGRTAPVAIMATVAVDHAYFSCWVWSLFVSNTCTSCLVSLTVCFDAS